MGTELTRADWESLKKDAENMVKRARIDLIQFNTAIKVCEDELAKLPEEEKENGKEKGNNSVVK